jgi:hypothetical protein
LRYILLKSDDSLNNSCYKHRLIDDNVISPGPDVVGLPWHMCTMWCYFNYKNSSILLRIHLTCGLFRVAINFRLYQNIRSVKSQTSKHFWEGKNIQFKCLCECYFLFRDYTVILFILIIAYTGLTRHNNNSTRPYK